MLNLYRRHVRKCPHRGKGGNLVNCSCPIWCDGELDGRRYRRSTKTHDWQRALRRIAALESPDSLRTKSVSEAGAAFLNSCASLEPSTRRKYANTIKHLQVFCEQADIVDVSELSLERLDAFRAERVLARTTASKELQTLRQFFGFCLQRRWVANNVAKGIKAPTSKPAPIEPYTASEIARILSACDEIGKGAYERLRARAMVLLLRHPALRVSDVATFERSRIRDGMILLHAQKNGGTVYVPVSVLLQQALDVLPAPRGAGSPPRYFFWNGVTSRRAVVGIAERTLATVFQKSGVPNAHAHRFRHTLATEILANGGTEQDVADILGISPHIVRKHYAKWSQQRQQRITGLMQTLYLGTPMVHTEKGAVIQ